MAITSTITKGVTSKIMECQLEDITAWIQNDTLTLTHADDPLHARQVEIYTASTGKKDTSNTTDYEIICATDTTTTVTALNAAPVAVKVAIMVPVT